MNNGDAWDMINIVLTKHELKVEKVLQLFECLLVFDSWCKHGTFWTHDSMDGEQAKAKKAIRTMKTMLKEALSRNTGNGWALSKFHDTMHIPMFISMFGAINNYNTSFCEHNHKYQAKIPHFEHP